MIDPLSLPNIADGEDKTSPLANRIRNNYRHLRKWAKRTFTNCFRIYDREISHFPVTIDFYNSRFCIHYFSPLRAALEPSMELCDEVNRALKMVFNCDSSQIVWKTRSKSKTTRQYEKLNDRADFFTVVEYGVHFKVNLIDYLDTGLFLDHRETRRWVATQVKGKKVLNLFAYTCSFSVHAALKGATFTKSVDLSNTYTEWGRDNFLCNHLSLKNNVIVRADCLKFLDEEIAKQMKYDLIVIDPPTISRSKKMDQLFDIQMDYIALIKKSIQLLLPEGFIMFSTNSRKFKFDESLFSECSIEEITEKTLPEDFRDKKIHRCWVIKQ